MTRSTIVVFLVALLALSSDLAHAQIVNVQPLVAKEAEEGFSGVVEASADWRTGNIALLLLRGNMLARYLTGDNLFLLMGVGEIGFKDGERFLGKQLEHLRYRRTLTDRWHLEIFAQHDSNENRRLSLRAIAGVGPRWTAAQGENASLVLSMAYMIEREHFNDDMMFTDAGRKELNHRLSAFASGSADIGERLKVAETLYAQPRFDAPDDIRLLSESELLVTATEHLSIKVALTLSLDTEPPDGVDSVDTSLLGSVQVSF